MQSKATGRARAISPEEKWDFLKQGYPKTMDFNTNMVIHDLGDFWRYPQFRKPSNNWRSNHCVIYGWFCGRVRPDRCRNLNHQSWPRVSSTNQPNNRRKFRSQSSDNMDRWKSRGGKSQGEDQRIERVRSQKMQVREKVGKPRFTVVFFPWFSGSGGSKSN